MPGHGSQTQDDAVAHGLGQQQGASGDPAEGVPPQVGQSIAALCPWPARTEATNWSVRVGCVYSGEACRTDQDRVDVGAYCPIHSMVREFYDYIIGDAPLWGDPVG